MTAEAINKEYSRVIQALTAEVAAQGVITRDRFKAIMSEKENNHGNRKPRLSNASTFGDVAQGFSGNLSGQPERQHAEGLYGY